MNYTTDTPDVEETSGRTDPEEPSRTTRIDPYLGTVVHVTTSRQARPNRPVDDCPFCVGGLEAPDPYDCKSFPNRWPALGEGRCEVVLYTHEHDASIASLDETRMHAVIDLWAERTADLRTQRDVEFVLVFENRGAEVGATISHPHGQIYAYDHIPDRPRRRLEAGWEPDDEPGDRLIVRNDDWQAWTEHAPVFPISIAIAPRVQRPDLVSLGAGERASLARALIDIFSRLDQLHERDLPYMMWINQSPTHWPVTRPWLNIEIVSPWRAEGVQRFIAAAEVACNEYFNPVDPADVARRLRACRTEGTL